MTQGVTWGKSGWPFLGALAHPESALTYKPSHPHFVLAAPRCLQDLSLNLGLHLGHSSEILAES